MPDIATLIQAYAEGPTLLRDAVRPASESDWDARPVEGKWSIREVVCHVADTEIVYADRMKRVIAEDNPTFFEADPDVFVPALSCSGRPLGTELDLIQAVRAHMLPILRACGEHDFRRSGVHSLDGPLTLLELLRNVTRHVPHHVTFIEAKLRALTK